MSGVDDRVVQMTFDNGSFERKLGDTILSLDKLTQSLKFQGAQDGFRNVSAAADSVNLSSMAGALDNISGKFSAVGAIGFSVITNLTTSALHFAETVANKVLDPLMSGGRQRAINLDNAKFAFQGLGIDVQAAMDSALAAVRGTSFGLDEAAKAAAQFGASGIGAGADMTQSLRGIAGIAAMTNRSFSEISDIMTSSAAAGKVTNQDLMQFSTRGLNAAAAFAKATGVSEAAVHQMATAGTLDYATFAKAMDDTFGAHAQEADRTFTGALGNMHAALSRLGAAVYIPQLENQRKLMNALSPAIDGVKTALQPVIDMFTWFSTIKTDKIVAFIGALDFTKLQEPMRNFADSVRNIFQAIEAFVAPVKEAFRSIFPVDALAALTRFSDGLENFTSRLKIGGETAEKVRSIFQGVFSVFDIVWNVIKELVWTIEGVIKGFSGAGSGVLDFSAGVGDALTRLDAFLIKGGALHEFFLKFRIALQAPIALLKSLGDAIKNMFDSFSGGDSTLGRMNSRIDEAEGGASRLSAIWQGLVDKFSGVIDVLDKVWIYIKTWFGELGSKLAAAFHPGDFNSALDIVNVGLLGGIALMLKKFVDGGMKLDLSGGLIAQIKLAFGQLTNTLKAMQTELKAEALEKIAIAIGVLTASLVVLSMIDSVALTKALTAMGVAFAELVGVMTLIDKLVSSNSAAIKLGIVGAALIEFATAAAILTLAIRNLSGLSWEELAKGLAGVAGGMLIMIGASQLMADGSLGMIASGAGMIAMSVGLLILSEAVKSFASMSWGDMAKGLVGVAGGLILITAAMNFMPASSAISGFGFIEISAGLVILAQAVKSFGSMDWGELGKGLLGIGASLLIVAGAMQLMPLDAPIVAAGFLILSVALTIMGEAIKVIGNLDMGTLAKGIGGIAAVLLILAVATNAMSGALAGAAAIVIVSAALVILTDVVEKLGSMKISDLIQGLVALAATLAVLGIAALLLEPVIPALLGLGVAIAIMGGGFALFGAGVWLVAEGLTALAESGVAGAAAFVDIMKTVATAIPELLGTVIKAIIDQAEELLKAAPLLVRLITAVLDQLLDTIIQLSPKLGLALVALFKAALGFIRQEYPDYVKTGFEILLAVLNGIRDNIGEIVRVVAEIVVNFLDALRKKVPEIVEAGYNLMVTVLITIAEKLGQSEFLFIPVAEAFMRGFVTGFTNYMPTIMTFFLGLPGNILGWLGDVIPTLLQKGVDLITGLLNGLATAVVSVTEWFVGLPGNIIGWLGDVVPTLLTKGIDLITGFLTGIVEKAADVQSWFIGLPGNILGWLGDVVPTLKDKGIDIIQGFLNGVGSKSVEVVTWFVGLPGNILGWLGDVIPTLKDKGIDIIQGFLNGVGSKSAEVLTWFVGLPDSIFGWIGDVIEKLLPKGIDIITGLFNGITQKFEDVVRWLVGLGDTIIGWIPNPLEMLKNIGKDIIQGLIDGINAMIGPLQDALSFVTDLIPFSKGPPEKDKVLLAPTGRMIMQGLMNGLRAGWSNVSAWLDTLNPADNLKVVDRMTKFLNDSFRNIQNGLSDMNNISPTITPVLDLTNVKMGAKDLDEMFNNWIIGPVSSFDKARMISTTADLAKSSADTTTPEAPREVVFNQYNSSPDALSTNDIYRHTKSQIALAKEELHI